MTLLDGNSTIAPHLAPAVPPRGRGWMSQRLARQPVTPTFTRRGRLPGEPAATMFPAGCGA